VFSIKFIEIDDAIGATSVYGIADAWGTLVIGLLGVMAILEKDYLMVVDLAN